MILKVFSKLNDFVILLHILKLQPALGGAALPHILSYSEMQDWFLHILSMQDLSSGWISTVMFLIVFKRVKWEIRQTAETAVGETWADNNKLSENLHAALMLMLLHF